MHYHIAMRLTIPHGRDHRVAAMQSAGDVVSGH
jgi:hypothetical protein